MRLESARPINTCCLFFERGFVENARYSLIREGAAALDEPDTAPPHRFSVGLRMGDDRLLPRIREIAARMWTCSPGWLEEQMTEAARDLVLLDRQSRLLMSRVPAARASTRQESLRRLERAREFLHAHASEPLDLAQAAKAACLSPFHFHRLFRQTFGETPHEYRTRLRLERARRRIELGSPVTEACFESGFASLGSFSRLFRRCFGAPPSAFRRA
jgi:AraC-like DNA-binding protein